MSFRWPPILVILLIFLLPVAAAHVPIIEGGGDELNDATVVEKPTKSWAIYTHYEAGQVDYYRLNMKQGEIIFLMLMVPATEGERGFAPDLALMGPGLEDNGTLPEQVQRADGGVIVRNGEIPPEPTYEPFSPSVFYEIIELSISAPSDGDYYVAIYDDNGGDYSLAVGKEESFTITEWLTIPIALLRVYQWEGQEWWAIALPGVMAFLIGLMVMISDSRKRQQRPDLLWLIVVASGLLMISSGVVTGYQMISKLFHIGAFEPAALLTMIFAAIPILLGAAALRMAHRFPRQPSSGANLRRRMFLLAIGLLGLLTWSGWLLGPVLAILAAALPQRWLDHPIRR